MSRCRNAGAASSRGSGSIAAVVRKLTIVILATFLASAARAQTTGRIEGWARSDEEQPLPGVTVTATSSSLQGERVQVTGAEGGFRLLALPPGDYAVTAELDGFSPLEVSDIRVTLDRTVTLALELTPGFGEEMTVSGLAPLIDRTDTTTGADFPEEVFENVPSSRSYVGMAFLAPGAAEHREGFHSANGIGPSVRGASASENRYIVDGLDVSDIGNGLLSSGLPFEFVDEVEVKTGGYLPEYGGALGGVVNVITKSGGNELRGDFFGYYTDDGLQGSSPSTLELGRFLGETEYDFGLDLGGKLIRDELWYFLALNPTVGEERLTNRQEIPFDLEAHGLLWAGKLSWQIDPGRQLVASVFGEETDGPPAMFPNAAGRQQVDREDSTINVALSYTSTLTSRLLLEASAGRHDDLVAFAALDDTRPVYQDNTGTGFWARQQNCGDPDLVTAAGTLFTVGCVGGPNVTASDGSRDELQGSLSRFAGSHELKAGVSLRSTSLRDFFRRSAPFAGPLVDATGFVVDPDGVGGGRFILSNGFFALQEFVSDTDNETEERAVFLQDRWRVAPNLTLNLGVRLDSLEATSDIESLRLDFGLGDMIAPRIGFVWDPARDGRSKLYGHFGRFFESIPLFTNAIVLGGFEFNFHFFLYPEDGSLPFYDNLGTFLFGFGIGNEYQVDPSIGPTHTDEIVLGFEYEVRSDLAVGAAAVYRELADVLEDLSVDGGATYFLSNPGGTYRTNPTTGETLPEPVFFPEPVREYRGLELTLDKRLTNDWQLFASYVYSETEGNYGGLGAQPHFSTQVDTPQSMVGAFGLLPNDRTHHFKVFGSYHWPFGLVTGFVAESVSGAPINRLGFFEDGFFGRFVTPRGSGGRTPDLRHLDLRLEYPIDLPRDFELRLIADVFNLTNEQSATSVDETWTFAMAEPTLDPSECGGPGTGAGTACPEGNPLWGTAEEFQRPRTLRLGVKVSF